MRTSIGLALLFCPRLLPRLPSKLRAPAIASRLACPRMSSTAFSDDEAAAVIDFWFQGHDPASPIVDDAILKRWFFGGASFDQECQ